MILNDIDQLLGHNTQTPVLARLDMRYLQVEPEDTLDIVLIALRQQTSPVIISLPESAGIAFEQPAHFAQLRSLAGEGLAGDVLGFVIPANRIGVLARHAHQYGYLFAPTLEKILQASLRQAHYGSRNTEELAKGGHQVMDDQSLSQPERAEKDASQEPYAQKFSPSQPAVKQTPLQDAYATLPEAPVRPPRPSSVRTRKRARASRRLVLIALLISAMVLVSATILTVLFVAVQPAGSMASPAPVAQVGTISFASSGQLDPTSRQGLNDQIALDLHHVMPPAAGHTDYAWLLPDKTDEETQPLLLGTLEIRGGSAHLDYKSPDHTDLLVTFSRFGIAEQDSGPVPVLPPLSPSAWRYMGEIPNIPTPGDPKNFSLLSHVRHLLAKDPTLQSIGLNGGLDIWLFRNSGKIVEYTMAARDDWSSKGAADVMRRQIIRILDYLYGSAYIWQKTPASTPFLIDSKAGRLGLLEVSPTQTLPSYLTHIATHLQGLALSPGHTKAQGDLAIQIDKALAKASLLMNTIGNDAVQLVKMNNTEIQQQHALDLINDMVTNANAAYVGQPDPVSGENTGGITFIHNKLQGLAMMPITLPAKGDQ